MAAKHLCVVALCLLALVAPSFQAGTIFADNLTPVREDATFFGGISSTSATVSGAEVGTLKSGHREGFFIESDGPIVSNTGSVTINAAQLIDFTGHSETGSSTVSSAGTVSMTGSHLDIDAGTFTGSGNAGSVSSDGTLLFQGGEMTIGNGFGAILFNATENDLSFGAAQGFSIVADDGTLAFENAVGFASDIGGASFTAVQGLNLEGNLVDIRSQNGASIQTTGSQTYTAGSIVELRSDDAVALGASGAISVTSANSFIEIDAASAAAFVGTGDVSASAESISITNEGSSESVFELNFSGDIDFAAALTADFATFGSGDLGMEATNSIDLSGQNDVTIAAREVLDLSSDSADVSLSGTDVNLSSALKNFTVSGDEGVSFSTTSSSIDLSDNRGIFGVSQGGSIMATLGDISVDSDSFRLEQIDHNEQNSGDLTVNINGDFDDTNDNTHFFSAGVTSFLAGSGSTADMNIDATDNVIFSSLTGPNDISFTTNTGDLSLISDDEVTVASTETRFSVGNNFDIDAAQVSLEANNVSELGVDANDVNMNFEDGFVSAREGITVLGVGGGVFFESDDNDINAQSLAVTAGTDFNIDAFDATFDANISFNFEAEGDVGFTASEVDVRYDKTMTVTADAITLESDSDLDVQADEVYFVSNFPNDRFHLQADTVEFDASFGSVVSGGDLNMDITTTVIQADDVDLTGFDEIRIIANTGNLDATNDLSFISAGAVEIETTTTDYTFTSLTINPSPDAGDLGDGVLLFDGDATVINSADYDETALTGDILVTADTYTATTADDYTIAATNSWAFTADNTFTHVATDDITFVAELGATTQSVDYSVTSNQDVVFANLADTTINSDTFDFLGTTGVSLAMDNTLVQASDLDITVGQDFTVQAVGDINYLANNQLTFTTAASIDKIVGGDYNVRGDETVTITDTTITYTGQDMVVNGVDFTTIDGEDDVVVNVGEDGEFFADLIHIRAGGDMTFEALGAAGIMVTAHDGEISFDQAGTFSVTANGATSDTGDVVFDATRSVRTEGELVFTSDGRFDIGLTDSNNPGVFVHTTSMDGNIVFDSVLGDFQVGAGSTFSGEAQNGMFSLASQAGQATTAQSDINWTAGSDISYTASETITYNVAESFSASFNGVARSNMESQGSVEFVARGVADGAADTVTSITVAEDMTMSTSEGGGLDYHADENLSFSTSRESAYVSTNLFDIITAEAGQFLAVAGDVDVFTTGGPVEFDSAGTYTSTSGANTEVTSGRDTIFTSEGTQSITSDVFTMHSVAGATILDTSSDDALFAAVATITLDSQGARTDPRDGVIMSVEGDLTVTSTGGEIVLNAFDQVIIGEQTRPDISMVLGGSASAPGFTAVSDGAIRFNAGGVFSWDSTGNVDVTTTEELVMIADQTLTLTADGTGPSSDLRVQATNGNVHFHADGNTGATAETMTLTSTTGNFKISGESRVPGSELRFEGDADIESRSFLSNSGLLQSTPASDLIFDGISGFTIASAVGSVGTIEITAVGDVTVGATADFEVRSLKNDGGIALRSAQDIGMETLTSGDIIFDASSNNSRGLLSIDATLTNTISSVNSFTITANNPAHDDLRNGDIYIFSLDAMVNFGANDQIEFQTSENFEIYVTNNFIVDAAQDMSFISSEDMIFHTQGGGFAITSGGDMETQNSPGSGGDLIFHTGAVGDSVLVNADNEILIVTGEDWIGENSSSFTMTATGADSLDQFGIRIQTEAVGGDIDFIANQDISSNSDTFSATTLTGDIRMASGLDFGWIANVMDVITTDTNMGGGDVHFTSLLGDLRFLQVDDDGNNFVEVFSSGEDNQAGRMHFEANGISPTSEAAIHFSADVGSAVIASRGNTTTEGNTVSFITEEKFNLELNGVFAYFGALDHDFVDSPFNPYSPYFGYNQNLFGQDPEQQITSIEAHGLDADIRFSSRESDDGLGVLHIVTGLVDTLGFELENYYSDGRDAQLTIIADGGSDAEIRFDVESGIIFRGVSSALNYYIAAANSDNYGPYLPESDANFVTTDPNADIELRTDENAQEARVRFEANDVLFQSQDRSWYGTTGDYGSSVNLITTAGDTSFTTRNNINTDASPGIAINSYDSKIHISAEHDGAVNFEAVRNVNVRADKGFLMDAPNVSLNIGNLNVNAGSGDVSWNSDFHQYTVTDTLTFTTSDPTDVASIRDNAGGDIKFRTYDDLTLAADPNTGTISVQSVGGGNIVVHFGSFLEVQGDTTVFGAMTFPMTQEDIRPGSFCNNLFQDNEVILVKQPINVVSRRPDLYSKFGVTMCLCNRETSSYACMNMDQFQY